MKLSTYATTMTVIAIVSLGANAWTLNNIRNISLARQACSDTNNVALKSCKLQVVNLTESTNTKLTLLMPPELSN